ncbi:MAG TPA: hypothetical protein VHX36_14635 [Candidatus Acidoferrales bacterium]|jgi:predicted TIM-barrel fold metal-dependent hydrolase|nr:hypothetical protein [Candidatus Acidoferrales bacterium]
MALVCAPELFVMAGAAQQDAVAQFQARFERETDPVRRAKLMQRLGVDEFAKVQKDVSQGDIAEAGRVVDEYRDQARSCVGALDAKKINAAKHESGFKQLQISVQEALRRLDEILAELTADQQPEFAAARSELQKMNDHLVQELFPSSPPAKAPAAKSDR